MGGDAWRMTRESRHAGPPPGPSTTKLRAELEYTERSIAAMRALAKHLRLMLKAAKS